MVRIRTFGKEIFKKWLVSHDIAISSKLALWPNVLSERGRRLNDFGNTSEIETPFNKNFENGYSARLSSMPKTSILFCALVVGTLPRVVPRLLSSRACRRLLLCDLEVVSLHRGAGHWLGLAERSRQLLPLGGLLGGLHCQ